MTMSAPQVKPWPNDLPASAVAVEEHMRAEGLPYYRWSNGPGDVYPAHSHTFHKVIYVVRGDITFGLPQTGARLTLHSGDRLDLPAGVVHDAVVGGKGVVCLEGHR